MFVRALKLQSRSSRLRAVAPSFQSSFSSTARSSLRTQYPTRDSKTTDDANKNDHQHRHGIEKQRVGYSSRRNQSPQNVASSAGQQRIPNPIAYTSRRNQAPPKVAHEPLSDLDLTHLVLNIVELSQNSQSNDYVMDEVRNSEPRTRELILDQILDESDAVEMILNKNSCRVMTSLFSRGDSSQRARIVAALEDYVSYISADQFGCSFIQGAFEELDEKSRARLVAELLDSSENAIAASMHPHGRFVMLKLVDVATPKEASAIAELLEGSAIEMCTDRHGCVFLKKCLSEFKEEQRVILVDELLGSEEDVISGMMDRYGHFIYQYMLEYGTQLEIERIAQVMSGGMAELAMNDNANFVVRSMIAISKNNNNIRDLVVEELLSSSEALAELSCSQSGKLVVQELLGSGIAEFVAPVAEMVKGRVLELITDEHGSFVVGCALGQLTQVECDELCLEILTSHEKVLETATHRYGRFVITKILEESGSKSASAIIGDAFKGQVVKLASSQFGYFTLRSAMEELEADKRQVLVDELLSCTETILDCVKDAHAHFLIEFLIEKGTIDDVRKVADAFKGRAMELALHERAHYTVKKALQAMPTTEREMLAFELRTSSAVDFEKLRASVNGAAIARLL